MSISTQPAEENEPQLSPEEVYQFFANLPPEELAKIADEAVKALDAAADRAEAEVSVLKLAPFFLDCTFARLPEANKEALKACLDRAEEKFGSLAEVLGLDKGETDSAPPSRLERPPAELALARRIQQVCRHWNLPTERTEAAELAHLFCTISPDWFNELSDITQSIVQGLSNRLEQRFGPIEALAAEFTPPKGDDAS